MTISKAPSRNSADPGDRERLFALPDGRLLAYMEFGDPGGVPLFGFHGTPGSRFMFRLAHSVAQALGIRLIAPERPGFGRSSFQRRRTLADCAQDMAALADALGCPRFAVAGVSGGGPYAAACAALLPDRVTALGLISPIGPMAGPERPDHIGPGHYVAFRLSPEIPLLLRGVFTVGRTAFRYAPLAIYGFIMGRAAPSDWAILKRAEVRRNLLKGVAEGMRPGVGGGLQEMRIFARPWNIPLRAIRAPAFLWQGTADRNVPVAAALRLGTLIPHCRVFRLEGAGHYWIFDHMEEVLETLADAAKSALEGEQPRPEAV